jgi:uncharacterized protein (TIGR02600 family)
MNPSSPQISRSRMKVSSSPRRDRGIALVIVLAFLVLLTVFTVAFLTSVTTDSQSSYTYAKGVQTQQLSQSAISIAMSQIKAATTQDSDTMWTTQPGMIKTFPIVADGSGSDPKKKVHTYRLYSSSSMVLDGSVNPAGQKDIIQSKEWPSYSAHMVDLNRPARDGAGNLVYPILDPRGAADPSSPGDTSEKIEGFTFDRSMMGSAFLSDPDSPAPMPVRWLYMLAKGDIVSGKETDRTTASFDAAASDNPVVGRIAFWTDDESSKVNINTAAGDVWNPPATSYGPAAGSFWDIPHTNSALDRQALANFQPTQGEYQRYPGHPATTYLSAVFPQLTADDISNIASRVQKGGSQGGTVVATSKIDTDNDRLYASIDELMFSTKLTGDGHRKDQVLSRERLERGRFFLTAHSRSPEANLFGRPRVAIWPISPQTLTTPPVYRSAYDRLIAFCSTIKNNKYYYERANADIPGDFTQRDVLLFGYLQKLTNGGIPGFGATSFNTKYGPQDRDQILTEILDYIRCTNLFDDTIEPGSSYTYPTKGHQFTDGRTSATGVLSGHGQVTPLHLGSSQGFGRFYTISEAALHFIATADPSVAESNVPPGPGGSPASGANRTLLPGTPLLPGQRRIEAMLLLEMFSPSQGWTGLVPDMQVRVRGLQGFSVNGVPLGFPNDGIVKMNLAGTSVYHGRAWGGAAGYRFQLNGRKIPGRSPMPQDAGLTDKNTYPFVSVPITITVPSTGNPTMNFSGGNLIVEIYSSNNGNAGPLIQTINLKYPSSGFPVPTLVTTGTPQQSVASDGTFASTATDQKEWWTFSADGAIGSFKGRVFHANRAPGSLSVPEEGAFVRAPYDVVRSLIPSHGDYRLVAARQNVPDTLFTPLPTYNDPSTRQASMLMEAVGFGYLSNPVPAAKTGYAYNVTYDNAHVPDLRPDIDANTRTRLLRGDFDTGVGNVMDGPYINKPDEGNQYRGGGLIPYFDNNQAQEAGGPTFFSPNRQMPSAVMFGSLPTGIIADRSYRTLLFRPDASVNWANPAGGTVGAHDGAKSPKDHLLLDLFWMPVV